LNKAIVESIVQEAKRDSSKFEPLYREYYGEMMSFVMSKTGDLHLAEELVSNCFFKALQKINTYHPSEKGFLSWLYTIAINEVRMHYRKSKTRSFGFDIDQFKDMISTAPNQTENELKTFLEQKFSIRGNYRHFS